MMMQIKIGSYDLNFKDFNDKFEFLQRGLDREIDIICFQKIKEAIQQELSAKYSGYQLIHGKDTSVLVNQSLQLEQSRVGLISTTHVSFLDKAKLIVRGMYEKSELEQVNIRKDNLSFQIWNIDFIQKEDKFRKNQIEEFIFDYMMNHKNLAFITHGLAKTLGKEIEMYLKELQFLPIFEQSGLSPIYVPNDCQVSIENKENIKLYKITKRDN